MAASLRSISTLSRHGSSSSLYRSRCGSVTQRCSTMDTRTVLISGAGIAGPTLVYWLYRAGSDDLHFDRVSQIHMQAWSRGRIALFGDAAFCASLMAGQGSALAMTAAYVL